MTTTTFDQAQHDAWAQDAETPAEREEREAREAGNDWDLIPASERTERDDIVAEDMEQAEREWLFGHGERPTWTFGRPAADFLNRY